MFFAITHYFIDYADDIITFMIIIIFRQMPLLSLLHYFMPLLLIFLSLSIAITLYHYWYYYYDTYAINIAFLLLPFRHYYFAITMLIFSLCFHITSLLRHMYWYYAAAIITKIIIIDIFMPFIAFCFSPFRYWHFIFRHYFIILRYDYLRAISFAAATLLRLILILRHYAIIIIDISFHTPLLILRHYLLRHYTLFSLRAAINMPLSFSLHTPLAIIYCRHYIFSPLAFHYADYYCYCRHYYAMPYMLCHFSPLRWSMPLHLLMAFFIRFRYHADVYFITPLFIIIFITLFTPLLH